MPHMTGAQLVEAARAGWPDLPVLIVSGYAELPVGSVMTAPKINKPFSDAQLAQGIRDAITAALPASKLLQFPGG